MVGHLVVKAALMTLSWGYHVLLSITEDQAGMLSDLDPIYICVQLRHRIRIGKYLIRNLIIDLIYDCPILVMLHHL